MKSGKTTDARDHVRTIFRSFFLFISWTRPRSRASTNGPFLTERDMLLLILRLAVPRPDDQAIRLRPAPRPVPHRRLPPRRLRAVSYTHLRAHETRHALVCRLLLEKKKTNGKGEDLEITTKKLVQTKSTA